MLENEPVFISGKIIWEKKQVSCENKLFVQNRSTNVHIMETWQKRTPFSQNISQALLLNIASIFFRTEGGRCGYVEEENENLQRDIEENPNSLVQKKEQVAVSSIVSVVKTSTSSCCSGKSRASKTEAAAMVIENVPTMKSLN